MFFIRTYTVPWPELFFLVGSIDPLEIGIFGLFTREYSHRNSLAVEEGIGQYL